MLCSTRFFVEPQEKILADIGEKQKGLAVAYFDAR